ncbi:MAG TPA: MCE family protein [Marmoricola sp.]|nr:MCE family protein [Marmoricola sp.]
MNRLRNLNPLLFGLLGLALVAALLVVFWPKADQRYVTAEFPQTVSLYEGSDVKILGVPVGSVDTVRPAGEKVVVTFHYDAQYKVPADAKAVIISPSVVGDRFIQLTPVWNGGATLEDHARLGLDRTAMPLELDQIFASVNQLAVALGPEGVNKPDATGVGALTRLLDSTARNFGGQGAQFNTTLKNLGKFTQTLSDNKDELFGTLGEIEKFTKTLADNDDVVRRFNDSLAGGADLLAGERQELAAVLENLGVAMRAVRGFVRDNRELLGSNIADLNRLSKILVKRRTQLDEILTTAPVALNNLYIAGDAGSRSLSTRANLAPTFDKLQSDPTTLLCYVLGSYCTDTPLGGVLDALGAAGRTSPFGAARARPDRVVEPIDRSLAGLVEVQR